jgi:hypothetical protein
MNTHPESKDSLRSIVLGGNSPDAKPLAVLAPQGYIRFGYSVRPFAAF